ncbi:MAG: hypothetical protein ACFFD4_24700 [Candidatus Odinarchaeota archaeon]
MAHSRKLALENTSVVRNITKRIREGNDYIGKVINNGLNNDNCSTQAGSGLTEVG